MYQPNLKSIALPVPDATAIGVLGGGCEHPITDGGGGIGSQEWYHLKECW